MRCVHMDFHTSPAIGGIGEKFDKEKFTKVIREANVDLVTVFGKCHHGYTYYPSTVGEMHPGLTFNLLKEQIDAIHAAGAKAPIYLPIGWSKKDADEHPEWHHIDYFTREPKYIGDVPSEDKLDDPLAHCSWTTLCPVGEYGRYLEDLTRELCENFDVSDGVFYDICFINDACACDACRAGMKKMGLDPENYEDAKKYYTLKRVEMMKTLAMLTRSPHRFFPIPALTK